MIVYDMIVYDMVEVDFIGNIYGRKEKEKDQWLENKVYNRHKQ
jgi:hypothetical protein